MKKNPVRILWLLIAFISLGLGVIGIALPILPTTPFLLLASFAFSKGSVRFHNWFTQTKLYKRNLEQFVNERAMTRKTKLCILLPVSAMLLLTFILVDVLPARICIVCLIIFKYYYFIARIRTIPAQPQVEDVSDTADNT
ncbi:MAG: YbaN family protein [Lachnospiraceae bacterium]